MDTSKRAKHNDKWNNQSLWELTGTKLITSLDTHKRHTSRSRIVNFQLIVATTNSYPFAFALLTDCN